MSLVGKVVEGVDVQNVPKRYYFDVLSETYYDTRVESGDVLTNIPVNAVDYFYFDIEQDERNLKGIAYVRQQLSDVFLDKEDNISLLGQLLVLNIIFDTDVRLSPPNGISLNRALWYGNTYLIEQVMDDILTRSPDPFLGCPDVLTKTQFQAIYDTFVAIIGFEQVVPYQVPKGRSNGRKREGDFG